MALLALTGLAHAWALNGVAWPPDKMPLEIHWTGSQPGFTHAELTETIEGAAAAWTQAGPCALQVVAIEDEEADAHHDTGGIAVFFGDPHDELEPGLLLLVLAHPTGSSETVTWGGVDYEATPPVQVVINDTTDFLPDTTIAAGVCEDELSLQSVLTREIGRLLGLRDSAVFEATMHPDLPDCDTSRSTLAPDDIEGLEAIYGDSASVAFSCDSADDDPLAVSCEVTEPADAPSMQPTWDFGDGSSGAGAMVDHDYALAGSYPVTVCLLPPECGEPRCRTQEVTVRDTSADPPETAEDSGGPADSSTPDPCGCAAATPESATSLAALLSVLLSRRRRRGTG